MPNEFRHLFLPMPISWKSEVLVNHEHGGIFHVIKSIRGDNLVVTTIQADPLRNLSDPPVAGDRGAGVYDVITQTYAKTSVWPIEEHSAFYPMYEVSRGPEK